jgi:aspartate aminotransferase-like enzyme
MSKKGHSINAFVKERNAEKLLFTAGPAALLPENITGLRSCFGRGDSDYEAVESRVMGALKKMSGHVNLARMQGSASLALEVMSLNFLYGRVLVVRTGYYSERLSLMANYAKSRQNQVQEVFVADWWQLSQLEGKFDWIFACYTETSCGLKIPIELLRATSDRLSSKLMLDATASIGLEPRHELAEVIAYSSCKGLFGLTGAAFIAYHEAPTVEVDSFYMSLANHTRKMMTGPYHAIASLDEVLADHQAFCEAVVENKQIFIKRMAKYLTRPLEQQPMLCTHVRCKIISKDERAILYSPRTDFGGSVVCHLGEVHLGRAACGDILSVLEILE